MAGQAAEGAVVSSFAAFLPKLFESQYGLTAGSASLLTGAIVVPGFAGGIFLGGWLVERWKLDVAQTAAFCYQIAGVALVFMCAFFTGCSSPKIAGINEPLGFAWADKSALQGCEHGAEGGGGVPHGGVQRRLRLQCAGLRARVRQRQRHVPVALCNWVPCAA